MNRYIEKFLSYLEIEKNYSSHTLLNYKLDLQEFFVFAAETTLEKIDYFLLRRYLAAMRTKQHKPRTLARKLSSLRSFFKFMQREKLIKENPATLLLTPKLDKKLPNFLSENEMILFWNHRTYPKKRESATGRLLRCFIVQAFVSANWSV